MRKSHKGKQSEAPGLLGVGLDASDGHQRLTRGEDFVLVGGSEETHERMQDVAIRVTEALQSRGKRVADASLPEMLDLLHHALGR